MTLHLRAYVCKKPWHGQVISAFDFDEESSLKIAAGEPKHACPSPQPEQLAIT